MSTKAEITFDNSSKQDTGNSSPSQAQARDGSRFLKWKRESEGKDDLFQSSVDDENFLKRQRSLLAANPVIHKINDARRTSPHKISFLRRAFIIISTSACFTILLTLFMSIPLSKVVMGIIFYDECKVQPMIPLYLLVGGSVACFRDLANMCLRTSLSDESYFKYEVPISVVALVYTTGEFTWFVYGSYYVYKTLYVYQGIDKGEDNYCNIMLYMYAFVVTTLSYCLLAAVFILSCATLYLAKFLDMERANHTATRTIVVSMT